MEKKILNKRALFDYAVLDSFTAGIVLTGAEVKSLKNGRASLEGSFVKMIGNELFLVNAEIFPYNFARPEGYQAKRTRKLLVKKKEILSLKHKFASGNLTLIPLECYNSHGWIKLKVAIAKGKKEYEKREKIRKKDILRDVERDLKGKG